MFNLGPDTFWVDVKLVSDDEKKIASPLDATYELLFSFEMQSVTRPYH